MEEEVEMKTAVHIVWGVLTWTSVYLDLVKLGIWCLHVTEEVEVTVEVEVATTLISGVKQ